MNRFIYLLSEIEIETQVLIEEYKIVQSFNKLMERSQNSAKQSICFKYVLTYNAKTWTLTERSKRKIQAVNLKFFLDTL